MSMAAQRERRIVHEVLVGDGATARLLDDGHMTITDAGGAVREYPPYIDPLTSKPWLPGVESFTAIASAAYRDPPPSLVDRSRLAEMLLEALGYGRIITEVQTVGGTER